MMHVWAMHTCVGAAVAALVAARNSSLNLPLFRNTYGYLRAVTYSDYHRLYNIAQNPAHASCLTQEPATLVATDSRRTTLRGRPIREANQFGDVASKAERAKKWFMTS